MQVSGRASGFAPGALTSAQGRSANNKQPHSFIVMTKQTMNMKGMKAVHGFTIGTHVHETMYVCPNAGTMTAQQWATSMAVMFMLCHIAAIKWGYQSPVQLHNLGLQQTPKLP